jgi:hypothetical protein
MGIDTEKARKVVESTRGAGYERYPFWQPPADLHEHVKFLSEPRTIETKHGPLEVVDVERPDEKAEKRCMNMSKVALVSQIKRHLPLAGKVLVIVGLGKPKDKKYFDFYVADEAQAVKDGVVERLEQVKNMTMSRDDLEKYVSTLAAARRP